MRNKILLIITILLSIVAVKNSFNKKTNFSNEVNVKILDKKENKLSTLNLEEYVIGVVAAEMPASFNEEALKAQAVAARTYAVYKINNTSKEYDLVTDVTNQSYITKEEMQEKWKEDYKFYYEKVKQAVNETDNLIMTYNDEAICAFYFAMSNGYTEESALVFGEEKDYIKSVDSSWDENVNNFQVTNTISKKEFCQKLGINCNKIIIDRIEKSGTGRVNKIEINGKTFKGTEVRQKLGLRSTDFVIEVSEEIKITTKGYGHGVGMSQYGANEMAKEGLNYQDILKYYYKNIKLEEINV